MESGEEQENLQKSSLLTVEKRVEEDEELRSLLVPELKDLPLIPRSAVEANFVRYYAVDFLKPRHDQYVYRHANGLCVIGLAPTHRALSEERGVSSVDFKVGKSDRSEIKVTGKRKRNAQYLQPDSALCNVWANGSSYTVRCCVKGSLLEVNNRLIKHPDLLNFSADREGYIAIIMPKPADLLKITDSFLSYEEYKKLRGGSSADKEIGTLKAGSIKDLLMVIADSDSRQRPAKKEGGDRCADKGDKDIRRRLPEGSMPKAGGRE